MSEADKMFEKLGYTEVEQEKYTLIYKNYDLQKNIAINLEYRTISCYDFYNGQRDITIEEFKVIKEMYKELRWI